MSAHDVTAKKKIDDAQKMKRRGRKPHARQALLT
jgi:hypothetical protein